MGKIQAEVEFKDIVSWNLQDIQNILDMYTKNTFTVRPLPQPNAEEKCEKCPVCGTELQDAPGIGPYCPKKGCPVIDGIDCYKPQPERAELPEEMTNGGFTGECAILASKINQLIKWAKKHEEGI